MTYNHNNKTWAVLLACILSTTSMQAQGIQDVVNNIKHNNLQLKAEAKKKDAEQTILKTTNNLGRTALSYSPFFAQGVQGVASSEMVVSQDFEFPTLYTERHKLIRQQSAVQDKDYEALQRDILLQARLLCLQLIHSKKLAAVLQSRKRTMENLVSLYEKKLAEGSATQLDVNKVKIECMQQATGIAQCQADMDAAITSLQTLNGGNPITFQDFSYPSDNLPDDETLIANYLTQDRSLQSLRMQTQVMQRQVRISRQGALPSLSVGYRRNTALEEQSHGFLIGAAIPLFSNRGKVKAAKAELRAAEAEATHMNMHTEAEVRKQIQQLRSTKNAMKAYDLNLLQATLETLKKATTEGQISAMDYCRETRDIADQMATYLELEYRYHTLIANLQKND